MKLTKSDDRFRRSKAEQYSVAFAISLCQRTGINTEQQSCTAFTIHKVGGQFGILAAYLARQRAAEYELGITRSIDDTSLQLHAGRVLRYGKEQRIELQRVDMQSV